MIHDFCVIGGGIVGLATALELLRARPGASLVLLEKAKSLAAHQTGHNSGVIHAGIYYKPGSLKAKLCRAGAAATKEFCAEHKIPFETRGKLVVATNPLELEPMRALKRNAAQNEIEVDELDDAELRRREPNVSGVGALFVPATGIVDYRAVCKAMGEEVVAGGGTIELGAAVTGIKETVSDVEIIAGERHWRARQLVICGGLQSDRLAKLAGLKIDYQIVPFRGEYFRLVPEKSDLVHHLIYPVPDPDLPFLGIHLTPMINGALTVGPNAVLGFAREGYPPFSFNAQDVMTYARFPGFWRLIAANWKSGLVEMRNSLFKTHYLQACRKYCPAIELADLLPYEAGIRAQAVMRDGSLVHDFLFTKSERILHVGNAPSPAATSAIPIAQMIAREILHET